MIRVFHGKDEYSISEAVARIRESLGAAEVRDSNTSVFEGSGLKAGQVLAAAHAGPFLAERRLVLVRGLLRRIEEGDKSLGDQWDGLAERLSGIPATTELVFVEVQPARAQQNKGQPLKRGGRALRAAGPLAEVREFQPLARDAVEAWLRAKFAAAGAQAAGDAVARLGWLADGDLRLLEQEVHKLALYAAGRTVTREDVDMMVSEAREESIFAAVDAILERKTGVAMRLLYSLFNTGSDSGDILNRLSSQVRLVLLARELSGSGVPPDEIGKRVGIKHGFALEKTLRQARQFNRPYLESVHRRLLAADVAIKTGQLDERLAIEILVARLAS